MTTTDPTPPYTGDERRAPCIGGCAEIARVDGRLNDGKTRMDTMQTSINELHIKIDTNNADTATIRDVMLMARGFFVFAGYFGSFVKWAAAIAGPVIAVIYTIKSGGRP